MKKVMKLFLLNREANLFDAKLYILKALIAVLFAYAIAQRLPLVHKDLISVLFGLMMTLEPVTVTGIRSGLKQITATLLGALVTALIIAAFGINLWTVALSISATLYLSLKINWREASPVAIFTSIYMTNFIQYSAEGEPSIILTIKLRMLALLTGVLFAVLFNFLFSLFFYRQMERKRTAHIFMTITDLLTLMKKGMAEDIPIPLQQVNPMISDTIHRIDWLSSLIRDREKETFLQRSLKIDHKDVNAENYHRVLTELRKITHLIYDTFYIMSNRGHAVTETDLRTAVDGLDRLITVCSELTAYYEDNSTKATELTGGDNNMRESVHDSKIDTTKEIELTSMNNGMKQTEPAEDDRILYNLVRIRELMDAISSKQ